MSTNERIERARIQLGEAFAPAAMELLWWSGDLTGGDRLHEAFAPGGSPWGEDIVTDARLSTQARELAAVVGWSDLFTWLCTDADQVRMGEVAADLASLSTDPSMTPVSVTHSRISARDHLDLEMARDALSQGDFIPVVDAFLPLDAGELGALLRRSRALTDPALGAAYRQVSRAYVTAFGVSLHPGDARDGLLDHEALREAGEIGSQPRVIPHVA